MTPKRLLCLALLSLAPALLPLTAATTNAAGSNLPPEGPVETFRRTFKYGTWAQQVEALGRFENIPESNRAPYEAVLSNLMPQLDNNELVRKFMSLIDRQKLRRFYDFYEAAVKRKDGKKDLATAEDLVVITEGLRCMNTLSNAAHLPLMADFVTNAARHRENQALMAEGLRGIEIHHPEAFRALLPPLVRDENASEGVQAAAVRALAAYSNLADLDFLINLLKRDEVKTLVRWTATASLASYAPDKRAHETLSALATSPDFEVRARALWALGKFPGEGTRELLLRACKDNAPRIRAYALQALSGWNEPEINELLEFKRKNDPEKSVRDTAEAILRQRGLVH